MEVSKSLNKSRKQAVNIAKNKVPHGRFKTKLLLMNSNESPGFL